MKVVIFAGGLGSRISEESHLRPKPMIEIGGKPMLWHIMKIYQSHGFNEFIVCLGYKGYLIKEYFANYFLHNADVTFDLARNSMEVHKATAESMKVTLVDTGVDTLTAGRLQRVKPYLDGEDEFMLTYGDGVSDIDLHSLLDFHRTNGKMATMTVIQPAGKFGVVQTGIKDAVSGFIEKPSNGGAWINGGFFVLNREVFRHLEGDMDQIMWEQAPLQQLTEHGELMAFKHHGFWKCMDTLRDKVELEAMWADQPRWKRWN